MSVIIATPNQQEYQLLDSGNFQKLERFGNYTIIRPEPQAIWEPRFDFNHWLKVADSIFDQMGSHQGVWENKNDIPSAWTFKHCIENNEIKLRLAQTAFKHIGVFPEQVNNWEFIYHSCKKIENPTVLNLFAYTGGASIAAAIAGAKVVHVDAIKQINTWAKDNAQLNGLNNIRFLIDDALKFVEREIRRGNVYQGIILDPPAFGNGPNGEKWILEKHLNSLVELSAKLLVDKNSFYLLNCYSLGLSPIILSNIVQTTFSKISKNDIEVGELALNETGENDRLLPMGVYCRFFNKY